ncbi:MAG: response regulator [Candidatus Riflebacteria bacterium]|nr:response regulator [Candidatus Riflebacteria bacterium]
MKQILIVEDENSTRLAIKRIIESIGFFAIECNNDEEALRLMRSNKNLALVICEDHSSRLISEMQKDAALENIPVIAMSSYTGVKHIAALLEQGASAFISKPCIEEDLLEYVKRYIS